MTDINNRGRGRRDRLRESQTETSDPSVVPAGATKQKTTRKPRPTGKKVEDKKVARGLGEPSKPVAGPPRKQYAPPVLGEAGDLPAREGALDETVRGIYEAIGDDPNKYVPVQSDDRPIQQLQAAITATARKLGRPIKTNIRVVEGKQVLYARPL